jgi:acyl carrier protein phosphodiesterase
MNYLAHLHIAEKTGTSMVGAMLGDFVKGRRHFDLAPELKQGVILHRKTDAFTEDDPVIHRGKMLFESQQRRFAGIALDVFWDHCLAKNFSQYAGDELDVFVTRAYKALAAHQGQYSPMYDRVVGAMMHYDWLNHYAEFDGVARALQGLSRRRDFLGPLVDCIASLELNYQTLSHLFTEFYPELLKSASVWCEEMAETHS